MTHSKEIRWRQRFENFEKAYLVLKNNVAHTIKTDLERAGLIQLFETTFELSLKVLKEDRRLCCKEPKRSFKTSLSNRYYC